MTARMVALGLALALLPAAGGVAWAEDAPDPVVGERGGVVVTASQVRQLLQLVEPEARQKIEHDPALLAQKVRERVLQLVLLKEAQAHQWDQRPDVAMRAEIARQNAIVESWVASQVQTDPSFPTDEQVQAAYDANKSKLIVPRQYHLAQIFVAAPASSGVQGDADGLRRANELRQQIVKSHADFAAVAKKSSEDHASGERGGDLGWLREDTMLPPIRAAVSGLIEGGLSEPIRSPDGWHLLKLIATRPATPATLAEARDTLVRAMRQERAQANQRAYLNGLVKDDPIKVNEIEIGKLTTK